MILFLPNNSLNNFSSVTVNEVRPQAAALGGAETAGAASAGTGSAVSMTTLVVSTVLSAIVACMAAVAIVMGVRYVRTRRARQEADRKFSNMQGRLSHATNMGFDSGSTTGSDNVAYDNDSLSNVDI